MRPVGVRGGQAGGGRARRNARAPACGKGVAKKRRCLRSASVDFEVHCFMAAAEGAAANTNPSCSLPERTPSVMRRAASVTLAMFAAAADHAFGGIEPADPADTSASGFHRKLLPREAALGRPAVGDGASAALCSRPGSEGGAAECSICFEEGAQVAAACGHTLCGCCAGRLCAGVPAHLVPACPFCRTPIASFAPAALAC